MSRYSSYFLVAPSRYLRNFSVSGCSAFAYERKIPQTFPIILPRSSMFVAAFSNNVARSFRLPDSVIAFAIVIDAFPSASPTLPTPVSITGKASLATILIASVSLGRNASEAAFLISSIFGLRPARNLTKSFCDSLSPASGSSTPPSFAFFRSRSARWISRNASASLRAPSTIFLFFASSASRTFSLASASL